MGFGEGDEGRWWITGVEWGWRYKGRGVDDPGGDAEGFRKMTGEARQSLLDVVNAEVLSPKPLDESVVSGAGGADSDDANSQKIDASLIRLVNFLRKSSGIL